MCLIPCMMWHTIYLVAQLIQFRDTFEPSFCCWQHSTFDYLFTTLRWPLFVVAVFILLLTFPYTTDIVVVVSMLYCLDSITVYLFYSELILSSRARTLARFARLHAGFGCWPFCLPVYTRTFFFAPFVLCILLRLWIVIVCCIVLWIIYYALWHWALRHLWKTWLTHLTPTTLVLVSFNYWSVCLLIVSRYVAFLLIPSCVEYSDDAHIMSDDIQHLVVVVVDYYLF